MIYLAYLASNTTVRHWYHSKFTRFENVFLPKIIEKFIQKAIRRPKSKITRKKMFKNLKMSKISNAIETPERIEFPVFTPPPSGHLYCPPPLLSARIFKKSQFCVSYQNTKQVANWIIHTVIRCRCDQLRVNYSCKVN